MDAQKLKELRREVELAQKHGTTPDISAWDLFEVLNIAERAVSPAESVLPPLPKPSGEWEGVDGWDEDAMRDYALAAHAEGVKQERKEADDCARHQAAQIVELRKKVEEAHAEGRRSAMEELHPQWLKEKEWADRAEAKIACTLGIGTGEGNLFVHGSYESVKAAQEWILRAETAEAALAARQAPDLKQIMVIVEKEFDWTDFMPGHKKAIATIKSRLRTLLSSTAQPLQPLNKVVQGEDGPTAFFTVNADFPYLQQEGGKETLANGWPNDFHEVVKGAEDVAHQQGRAAAVEEAIRACEAIAQDHRDQYKGRGKYAADNPRRADPHADGCFDGASECADAIRAISPQPSDNLQQASTAQGEPTDEALRYATHLAVSIWRSNYASTAPEFKPLSDLMGVLSQIDNMTCGMVRKPAQATPEGADLPPLSRAYGYLTGCNLDMESTLEAAQAVCDHDNAAEMELRERDSSYTIDPDWQPRKPEPLFDAAQMREYARNHEAHLMQSYAPLMDAVSAKYRIEKAEAALAAITAAEPVYQAKSSFSNTWVDMEKEKAEFYEKADMGYTVHILYRAAQPQQVDTGGLPG